MLNVLDGERQNEAASLNDMHTVCMESEIQQGNLN